MRDAPQKRLFIWITGIVDRKVGWSRLPKPLALLVLTGIRMKLRRTNLIDPEAHKVAWGPEPLPDGPRPLMRTITGQGNDLERPKEGSAGEIFGRNVDLESALPQNVVDPNPRIVSNELLARRQFIPATSLNLIAAAWLQFEVHDWMSHGENEPEGQFEVELAADDPWTHGRPMLVERTQQGPPTTDGGIPTYRNTETHWWDASQVYGSTKVVEDMLRSAPDGTRLRGGKLRLTDDQLLPFNPATFPLGHDVNLAGVAGNWWVGLAMMHTLFMREHNAICDRLAQCYPDMTDDQLYDHARLINAALIAKIHTIEWTPALLTNPILSTAMDINWFGVLGERVKKLLGRVNLGEEIDGITGSKTYDHGAPYAMTEEFVAVYRMHPLIPDDYRFRRAKDDGLQREATFNDILGLKVDDVLAEVGAGDLFYSFGTSNPGAIVLHNYPNALRELARPGQVSIDLATYDIVKCRERGVPRYNDFRRQFHLNPAESFDDFSRDPSIVAELKRIYAHPDDVDTIVGLFAESPPSGMAFSDTAFRVFTLMASRRLKSDRFYTYDYRPEVYTEEGMRWIETNTMSSVLLRHYPELSTALEGVQNAFHPWKVADTSAIVAAGEHQSTKGWARRKRFWDGLSVFKFSKQEATVVPVPKDGRGPVKLVPFDEAFPDIAVHRVMVGDHVPHDEDVRIKRMFVKVQERLERRYPPMQAGLPSIAADARDALDAAYTPAHRRCYPSPVRPARSDLGWLAVASPYAAYLQADGSGGFRWDLSSLGGYECQRGLLPLGATVDFAKDANGLLQPTGITTARGTAAPGDPGWDVATRMAVCSLNTHLSMIRHFSWLHLVCGGPLAAATRNALRADHPVRRLMWPHVFGTQHSNGIVTELQMGKGGDFESIFSLTHRGMCQLVDATADAFDLASINPLTDAARRGLAGSGLTTPAQNNHEELYTVFLAHARRYLAVYFASDDDVAQDQQVQAWIAELDRTIPHGTAAITGGRRTVESLAELAATFIYFASVEHEIVGTGVWDYQMWADTSPVRMYADGRRLPLDVYQRLVNANFNLNVHRTMLLEDFSTLALDDHGAAAFRSFLGDLTALQSDMNRTAPHPWRMEPKRLKANINA